MSVVAELPHKVRVIDHAWIPMSDGCRLAAKLWIPEDAEDHPVPAILEYIPYRKNDYTAVHDESMHAYFAGHGYVAARIDLRGSGDSDGILEDEYLPLEQADGIEVIKWLASQDFCSGKVGMIGISWGGFNGLQIAAHAPAELGAVVSICSTDDRYLDDVHYMGGCLLASNMLSWASVMLAYNARPPDPAVVGDAWRDMWLDRMESSPPFVESWVTHQRRDEFWKQGSVAEDFSAITCPVYMAGGWSDAYRNAILRFLEGYPGPCKGLIGPWNHTYPEQGVPGPAIGFLQECVRFYDCHLKGTDNGIMAEPKLRVYLPEAFRSDPGLSHWPGRWIAAEGWPANDVETRSYRLGGTGSLGGQPGPERELVIRGAAAVASDPGTWGGLGGPVDNPSDQRPEDGQSLCFDTEALAEPVEMLGFPVAHLEVSSDQPLALVVVRLCDLWPDGTSTLITRGLLNLTHRDSHAEPEELKVGQRCLVEVKLNSIGYSVPAGHRLRLAVSPTYWPWAWPSPHPVLLSVYAGGSSSLDLPLWAGGPGAHEPPPHFFEPEEAPTLAHVASGYEDGDREVIRDVASGRVDIEGSGTSTLKLLDDGLEYRSVARSLHRIVEGEPLSAFNSYEREISISRGDWRTRVHTLSTMSSTDEEFQLTNLVEGYEGDCRIFAKTWRRAVPRDYV
jgi:putative CocE/NonD family hydrolase